MKWPFSKKKLSPVTPQPKPEHVTITHYDNLPPFSGMRARCVKCGSRVFKKTTYAEQEETGGWYVNRETHKLETHIYLEQLQRTCPNCGYSWYEAPLDSDLPASDS